MLGIDIGGVRKGFHLAWVEESSGRVLRLREAAHVEEASEAAAESRPTAIALDGPPRASIRGPETRLAERAVAALGIRIQWTRRPPLSPPDWMVQSERLWEALRKTTDCPLIETFPTLVFRHLGESSVLLPLSALAGGPAFASRRDLLDAVLCAHVALRYRQGRAIALGEGDELGPIYY